MPVEGEVRAYELGKLVAGLDGKIVLVGAFAVDLWRINIGNADFLTIDPECVTIDNTVVTRTRWADGQGESWK